MASDLIFSWAEKDGRMVHVSDVQKGLGCGCICPNCHEPLMARHGEVREHHFAHHGDNRGANLKICYMVILYKLAEQIIKEEKRICAPSYYGIFPKKELKFVDVRIDGCYEREDKQPDVIATTEDGKKYLIEFTFDYKVKHHQAIDYVNLNCLKVDLSEQTLESLKDFLLNEDKGRKWLNNQDYFDGIIPLYQKAKRSVELKDEEVCQVCELRNSCAGAKKQGETNVLVIENSGHTYRLCKTLEYERNLEELWQIKQEREKRRYQEEMLRQEREQRRLQQEQERKEWEERQQKKLAAEREEAQRLEMMGCHPANQADGFSMTPKKPIEPSDGGSRFVYYEDGYCVVSTKEGYDDVSVRFDANSKAELIIPRRNSKICNVFQLGLVYMLNHGEPIRNCKFCSLYSDHEASFGIEPFCGRPLEYGEEPTSKQQDALTCRRYNEDRRMIEKMMTELEEMNIVKCF